MNKKDVHGRIAHSGLTGLTYKQIIKIISIKKKFTDVLHILHWKNTHLIDRDRHSFFFLGPVYLLLHTI